MLKINREMEFQPAMSQTLWQMPLDQVDAYISARTWQEGPTHAVSARADVA